MASRVRQIKILDAGVGTASAGTFAGQFDNPVVASNTLLALSMNNDGVTTASIADDLNGSWSTALDTLNDTDATSQTFINLWGFANSLSGSPTITVTYGSSITFRAVAILEVEGVLTTSLDKHISQIQAGPGTGTDAVTSGNTAALTSQPNILIAFSMNTNGSAGPPTAGSGFLDLGVGWAWDIGFNTLRVECKNTTSTSGQAGTFTAITGTDRFSTFVIALRDSSPTISVQPNSVVVGEGSTATFSVTAAGSGTLHYQWRKNGSNVGTDSSSYTTPATVFATDNLTYYDCVVTDSVGSATSISAELTVQQIPSVGWFTA